MSASVAHSLVQMSLVGEALDRGPVAVFVADDDMRYLAANDFACELLGYTREELISLGVPDVVAHAAASNEFAEMVRDGSRSGRTILTRKGGSTLEASYRASETTIGGLKLYVSVVLPDEN